MANMGGPKAHRSGSKDPPPEGLEFEGRIVPSNCSFIKIRSVGWFNFINIKAGPALIFRIILFVYHHIMSDQDFKGVDVHFVIKFNNSVDSRFKFTSILEYVFTQLVLEKD